jgi:cysteine desulfuration protein SufE
MALTDIKSIPEIQEDIVAEFDMLGEDWQERYGHIIELGKSLPHMPEDLKNDENKVSGCQSSLWLASEKKDGRIFFKVDSDALIVRGLAALMLRVFSGHTPDEILDANTDFIQQIGLQNHLSPTRSNGLYAMLKQIKFYALAYRAT